MSGASIRVTWRPSVRARDGIPPVGAPRTVTSHVDDSSPRLLAGDEAGAWGVVETATAAGADPAEVLTSLVAPALERIGAQWAAGELSVADEHRATAVAHRLVARLGPSFVRPGRRRGTVVLGSVAGDRHALPTAMLGDLLRGERFEVVDLGPDTPAESFVATAVAVDRLQAVGICVSDSGLLGTVPDFVQTVRAGLDDPAVPVHVGGSAITDVRLAQQVGSDGFASDPSEVVALFASPRVSVLD